MDLEIHLVKENVVLPESSRSHEKLIHEIKVLMAKNYTDNLSEEVKKGMLEKAEQGIWPGPAPFGYLNVSRPDGKRIIVLDPERSDSRSPPSTGCSRIRSTRGSISGRGSGTRARIWPL